MVALLVILSIVLFLLLDGFVQYRQQKVSQQVFYHPDLGLTMADGGEEIKPEKETNDSRAK